MKAKLLTYKQVSEMLGLPLGTLYSLVSQKRVPHKRLGKRLVRFSEIEIQNWVESNNVEINKDHDNSTIADG